LGGSPEGCQERLEACVADVPPPLELDVLVEGRGSAREQNLDDVQICTDRLSECNLSVAQLEGCINVRLDWVYSLVSSLSCAGASNSDTRSRAEQMRGVTVCAAGRAGCDRFINVGPELL
jgi:hypothetical protein